MKSTITIFPLLLAALSMSDIALAAQAADPAGKVGPLNPSVSGTLWTDPARDLFQGSDVFVKDRISTGDSGRTQLQLLEGSTAALGPNSRFFIDRVVHYPDTGTGSLVVLELSKGDLYFTGGAASDKCNATIKTPLSELTLCGAIVLVKSNGTAGETTTCLIFGKMVRGRHTRTGNTGTIARHEHCLRFTPTGQVEEFGPLDRVGLDRRLAKFWGPASNDPPVLGALPLPPAFSSQEREISDYQYRDAIRRDEVLSADAARRDLDAYVLAPPPPPPAPPPPPPSGLFCTEETVKPY